MMMISKEFTLLLVVLLLKIFDVECKGKLAVKLVDFHNKEGLDFNGQCCDGVNIPTCPLEQCDHHFTICVGDHPIVNHTDESCMYGKEDFNAHDNENEVYFTAGKASLFTFDTWKGWAYLSVLVTDSDSDGLVPVDNLYLNFTSIIPGFNSTTDYKSTYSLIGQRTQKPTEMSMKVKVYCDPHFYGDDCSINCVGGNACDGHYTCDNKGRKVCNSGWKGDNCEVMIQGDVADCSVYQDRTEFVPSLWEGQYQCPGETPQNFVLNVTRSSGNIDVVADMTIQSFVIELSGTYAASFKILTLQGQTLVPQDIGGRNLTKLELNLQEKDNQAIEMKGDVIIDQDTCHVLRLTRTKAYFDGCNMHGTCVRYGSQKDQFYCCCNDGDIKDIF
ncbi:delta-like protein D [Pecten maximus]|uniref:delta-like protein D n=1 Tax=Pecten maximus TaxID=6579 RepID=UPI001458EA32|nr:delta-like protein D [Pecten maximus]